MANLLQRLAMAASSAVTVASMAVGDPCRVAWAPQPGSQVHFMSCPYFECLYEGTRGPGKTDALLMDFAQSVGKGYGPAWRGILFRMTYKQLDDVVTRSKRWFYQIFPGARFLQTKGDYKWVFPTGEELLLRVMDTPDDYWNYHGHEYPWIGWEELTNWPSIDCYEIMKSCCRSSKAGMPRKYRATCNPYGVGHNWVKAYFIDPAPAGVPVVDAQGRKRVRLFGSIYENKILLAADPDYLKNIESISDPNKRRAWLYGDWNITSGGAVDDIWDQAIHVIRPFQVPHSWIVDRSFDWGSSKPFSVGWWAESDGSQVALHDGTKRTFSRGTLFRIQEWYGCAKDPATGLPIPNKGLLMQNAEIGRNIAAWDVALKECQKSVKRIQPGPADSSIFDKMDGASIYDKILDGFRKAPGNDGSILFVEANKNPGTRKQGLQLLRDRLEASKKFPMEDPGIFIFDTCTAGFLRTVPVLPRSEKDPDDVDSAAEDHAYDEARYRILHKRGQVGTIKLLGV